MLVVGLGTRLHRPLQIGESCSGVDREMQDHPRPGVKPNIPDETARGDALQLLGGSTQEGGTTRASGLQSARYSVSD